MKNIGITYIAAVLLMTALAGSHPAAAQEYISTAVEISKEKVKIDGKVCYSHVVQEKQTLYSISKAYQVSIDDIYLFNPTLKETGLKKNSIIIIPSKDAIKAAQPQEVSAVKADNHTDSPKTVEPAAEIERIHIAKWYEDLDIIAAQYGVSAESIIKANKLKGKKLGKRQKLIIPMQEETSPVETVAVEPETSIVEAVDTTTVTETAVTETVLPLKKVNAGILLPITNAEGQPNRNNVDFYCGALIAVYDLANEGIDCNLNVFDIMDNRPSHAMDVIKGSDVVIGPISTGDLTRVFFSAPDLKGIVSPLDPRAEKIVKDHPAMIQAPTPHIIQYRDLVKWIKEDYREGDKVVMITEKGARHSNNITSPVKEALDSSALAYSPFSYSILEGRDITEPLTALMSTEGANRILVASESEAFVNDVIRNLNLLIYNNLEIVLYTPSKVKGFETIEVENFHNTTMHVSLGYYIDYESEEVKDFLLKYRALYNTEPTQFAFQGYDVAKYFFGLSARYGESWKEHLTDNPEKMLQSTFDFVKNPSGGYINNGVRRIVYEKGYEIRNVK